MATWKGRERLSCFAEPSATSRQRFASARDRRSPGAGGGQRLGHPQRQQCHRHVHQRRLDRCDAQAQLLLHLRLLMACRQEGRERRVSAGGRAVCAEAAHPQPVARPSASSLYPRTPLPPPPPLTTPNPHASILRDTHVRRTQCKCCTRLGVVHISFTHTHTYTRDTRQQACAARALALSTSLPQEEVTSTPSGMRSPGKRSCVWWGFRAVVWGLGQWSAC